MKKNLIIILLSISTLYTMGQQVYFETGVAVSAFDYKNSQGETIDNLFGSNNFFVQSGFRAVSSIYRMNYSAGISYASYGARGSDSLVGNYFDWDVDYIGIDLGMDYELIKKRFTRRSVSDFNVYIKTTLSPEFLVHGTQTINHDVYNLIGAEQFKYPYLFVRGGIGVCYSVNKLITVYTEYMGGKGFPFKASDQEKLRINSHNIGIGLYINLPSYRSWK